jgi:putative endonuclease
MTKRSEVGQIGEDIACEYLKKHRYKIIARNYREKFDEIDIIAKSFDGVLVFCEVKTVVLNVSIMPEDNMTKAKFKKISRICSVFAAKHHGLVNPRKGWRIDLIAIVLKEEADEIRHYENISEH